MTTSEDEHRRLVLETADLAAAVLPLFEEASPGDHRPADAVEAARAWARGEIDAEAARQAAFGAHAAAREASTAEAVAAARAAGHAAATADDGPGHAPHAAQYAARALEDRRRRDARRSEGSAPPPP